MTRHDSDGLDPWASWLVQGRDANLTDEQRTNTLRQLQGVRDEVLRGARLQPHDRVLDVGAGTGLVALEVARRSGHGGRVVAVDISLDTLALCREQASRDTGPSCLHPVVGDGVRLPFPDNSFDVVLTRSALIYVWDKPSAIQEIFRVLGDGGRVSIFEPINAASQLLGIDDDIGVPAELRSDHEQARTTFEARSHHWEPMMAFDERDLVRWFSAAGFEAVGLRYELLYLRAPADVEEQLRLLDFRGNPTAPTWREAAVEALGGENADAYLHALAESRARQLRTDVKANAFLTATRGAC